MSIKTISAKDALRLIDEGATLIDIRSPDEYARERIARARNVPMERLAGGTAADLAGSVIFLCRSGARTRMNAQALAACVRGESYVLEGGLDAWKKAGLPVAVDASRPLEMQRQVQIAAGSAVLLGTVLAAAVSPWWLLLPGFVGSGLVFAGVTGFCGLARVLARMPWNRRAAGA